MRHQQTPMSLLLVVFSLLCLASACTGGGDPESNDSNEENGPDAAVGPDAGLAEVNRETCERYLQCASATAPGLLPSLEEGFGANGTCWEEGDPDGCLDTCLIGLSQLRADAGGEPLCGCQSDSECLEAGSSFCDTSNGQCGSCSTSSGCLGDKVCFRSPTGSSCGPCDENNQEFEVCGYSSTHSPDLWAATHACTISQGTPVCVECTTDEHCSEGFCDLATNQCAPRKPSCTGIWECLRHSPIECTEGADCCGRDACPQIDPYVACMSQNCAGCQGDDCIGCSIENCVDEYNLCDSTCS